MPPFFTHLNAAHIIISDSKIKPTGNKSNAKVSDCFLRVKKKAKTRYKDIAIVASDHNQILSE